MKKILCLGLLGLLCSCHRSNVYHENGVFVIEHTYKNHKYLIMKYEGSYGHSIIHDPECMLQDELSIYD